MGIARGGELARTVSRTRVSRPASDAVAERSTAELCVLSKIGCFRAQVPGMCWLHRGIPTLNLKRDGNLERISKPVNDLGTGAESQQIVATRPLYCLQYPVSSQSSAEDLIRRWMKLS